MKSNGIKSAVALVAVPDRSNEVELLMTAAEWAVHVVCSDLAAAIDMRIRQIELHGQFKRKIHLRNSGAAFHGALPPFI